MVFVDESPIFFIVLLRLLELFRISFPKKCYLNFLAMSVFKKPGLVFFIHLFQVFAGPGDYRGEVFLRLFFYWWHRSVYGV